MGEIRAREQNATWEKKPGLWEVPRDTNPEIQDSLGFLTDEGDTLGKL